MKAPGYTKDPTDVSVQIQFRAPFWYREQLAKLAREHEMTLAQFCSYAIEKQVPPVKRGGR